MPTPNESPERIEDEIRGTRREIDRTLDALQSKLSPGQLLDHALSYVKDGGGEFASNLGRTVSRNPVPVVLLGIGLTWLMCSDGRRPPRYSDEYPDDERRGSHHVSNALHNYYSDASGAVQGAVESVQSGAAGVRERIHDARDAATGTIRTVAGTADDITRQAGDYAQSAWHQGVRAKDRAVRTLQDYPALAGALGLAAGAMAAAFLPQTRQEDELMGRAADQLKRSTKETLQEAKQEAADALQSAAEASEPAAQTAERQQPAAAS